MNEAGQPVGSQDTERLGDLFALQIFFRYAIQTPNFELTQETIDAVCLDEYGNEIYSALKPRNASEDDAKLSFTLLRQVYGKQMFLDHNKTDIEALFRELSNSLQRSHLRLPYVYGGLLYFHANQILSDITDVLSPKDTSALLDKTPQGVFQLRSFVSGPFGLLRSNQKRDLRPTRRVALWHCSDPSCTAIHFANLNEDPGPFSKADADLRNLLREREGPRMRVSSIYGPISEDAEYYDDLYPGSLVPLLGDGFSLTELRSISKSLLERPNALRSRFTQLGLDKILKGSALTISEELNQAGCLQLILLESDIVITSTIEMLIDQGTIAIPLSEVRSPCRQSF